MKRAFILSGEGSRGSFQARAMNELGSQGIVPDFISGVSSGAMNAVGYSVLGPQRLCGIWHEIEKLSDVFSFNPFFLWQSGIYTTKPIMKKISSAIGSKFSVPGEIYAVNSHNADILTLYFKKGDIFQNDSISRLKSAISIPGLVVSENDYLDAAPLIMAPLKAAIENDCEEIYLILGRDLNIYPDFSPPSFLKFGAYAMRFLDLAMHNNLLRDVEKALAYNKIEGKKKIKIHVVSPARPLGKALDFKLCRKFMTEYDLVIRTLE